MPFACGVISGKLFDLGYFRILVIAGSVIFSFSLCMLSLAQPQHYYQVGFQMAMQEGFHTVTLRPLYLQVFLTQGVGMGIGLGLTFVPSISILVLHFEQRRALASGIALSGSSVGAVVFPIMINHLIPKIGFADTVRATACIVIGFLIAANGLMRNNPAIYGLRAKAAPVDVLGFFTDLPYVVGIFGSRFSTPPVHLVALAGISWLTVLDHGICKYLVGFSVAQ
ncbi:hypothetical protein H0H92_009425 [Tricholoma furcatifolium]|nr:hypothetical protein H0H92_009425 [Tricholoma furcatifolium]